jgi:hypothetical protein
LSDGRVIARVLRLLLVVALLAGWQASLLHPLEHRDEAGALVHLANGADADSHEHDTGGKSLLCDLIAALAACAPHAQSVAATLAAPAWLDAPFAPIPPRAPSSLAHGARAPPSLL